jgi:hypothetical protein
MACLFILACEDVIDPKLEKADPIMTVDAWLVSKPGEQLIQLTWSVAYDDNDEYPPGVKGATVSVLDNEGKMYEFIEDSQKINGTYVWKPVGSEVFGKIGNTYTLTINYNGETFSATSKINPVPAVDSIAFEYVNDDPMFAEGYRAEFWGNDLTGEGNTYWIKTYKNGTLLNKPSEINIAYDAGISTNTQNDGKVFLPPIRLAINPNDVDDNDKRLPAYRSGDSVYVEINSITLSAYNYLNEVITNTNRQTGVGSLFSTAMSNVSTNVTNNDTKGSPVVGFFNTAAASGKGKKFVK